MKNSELHKRALSIANNYHKSITELLTVLQELDQKKAYLDYECRSLFDYCTKILKLSEDISLNFIRIARASIRVPEIKERIKSRELSISNARKVASVITPENADHWIKLAMSLPTQKLEQEIAKVAPKAAIPDQVKILSEDYVEFRTTLSQSLLQKLKRARDLESQRTSKAADYEQVLNQALELYLEAKDPIRKAKRAEKKKARNETNGLPTVASNAGQTKESPLQADAQPPVIRPPRPTAQKRKPIPASIKNAIQLRDQGCCTYVDTKGQRCDQKRWIHTHHVIPVSEGGTNELENLTTLCWFHHDLIHQLDLFASGFST